MKGITRIDERCSDMINDRFTTFVALHQALDIFTDDNRGVIAPNVTHHSFKGLSSLPDNIIDAICKLGSLIVFCADGLANKARNYNVNGWHQHGIACDVVVRHASAEVLNIIKQVLKVSKVIMDPCTFPEENVCSILIWPRSALDNFFSTGTGESVPEHNVPIRKGRLSLRAASIDVQS